jgi:TP901 family phage tail tape measure protein|nr:MAG TPA: tail tape measure protein [Caudoviricetes sp.]
MANLKTEIILSMNGKAAIQVLEALRDKAKAVREEIDNLDKGAPDFKEQKAGLEKVYDALQSAHENVIKDTERLDHALQNLTSTSLQNLRKALGDGRRQLQKLSEDELEQAEEIRKKMKQVGDEVRLLEGQYVKISEGLKNVSNQSDQWLDKAIKQQRDLVGSLEKSDAGYQKNLSILKQLEAEEDRRKGKMNVAEARQTVSDDNASASDLRRAKATLTEARDKTAIGKTGEIDSYNRDLQEIEKRLEAVSGKTQKASMSWKQMKQVLAEPNKASGEDIKRTMEVIQQKIQQLPAGSKYVATLRRQYSMLEQTLKGTRMSQSALNDILARSKKGKASLDELRRAYKQLEEELNQINTKSKEFAEKQKSMKELKKNIDEVTGAAHKQGGAWSTAAKNLVAYVGLFGAFNMIKQKITDVINLNFKYSDSLANVRKVTNWSMKDVEELSNSLSKMDSRTSLEGLTQLAYIGSRMGMGKYGVQGLAEFAQASDRVNVALKEDLGDDAMLTLSKFVETMGEVEKHGGNVGEAFDSVSSSIFKLASTSTANGGNILEFAKRLTGLSKSAHITSDQLLGLASASDSLMLMPEVASTAFGKLITSLWTNYHDIEKMLGMQEDSLKDMMSKGQTMQALVKVLENVSDKNLSSMDEYFKEFDSDGQRLKSVVVTMAQNIGVLKSHLKESSEAYREGTAVTKEYEIQQQTAQAILERANNMWEKAFVNPNGIDAVKEMAKVWYNFSKELTQSKPFLASVKILFWELKTSVEALLFVLPGLLAYLGTRGLVMAFSKLIPLMIGIKGSSIVGFFTLLTQAIMGSHFATLRLIVSWKQLSLAMKTNIIGLVISVVTSLGVAIYDLVKKTDTASSSVQKFNRSFEGVREAANHAVAELDAYYGAIKRAKKGSNEYQAAMKTYVDKFGMYFKKLKDENGMVKNLAASYREAAKAIRGKIYLQMQEDDIQKHYKPRIGWSLDKLDAYGKIAPKGFGTDVLKGYEEDNRNKNMGTIIADLARRYGSKNVARVLASEKEGRSSAQVRKVHKDTLGDGTVHQYVTYEDLPIADQRLFSALRYIRQARSANNVFAGIKNKFAVAQDEINDYLKAIDAAANEDLGGGGGGKGGSGGGGKNTPKTDNTANQEEQKAKTRANALIANIKAFYEEQMRKYLEWVAQMNADGEKISEGQQKEQLDYLQSQMDRALGMARQSIANLGDGWKEFYSHMDEDVMVFDDDTSKQLLESIGKADVGELHKLFAKLSGDLSRENNKTLAENLGALLDQIFANGSKELREAAEKLLARQREIQKILNEHDYTGAVDRNTRSEFDRLGFLHPAKDIRADSPEGLEKMNTAFDKLTTKARESITVLYSLNPESEEFQNQFLQFLSVANEGFDFSKLSAQNLKALYLELIKYSDEYTAAEKKNADERKKINDFLWNRQGRQADQDNRRRAMQQVGNGVERFRKAGKGEDSNAPRSGEMGGSKFMEDFSYNANIEQSKLEITLIQEKIAWLQKLNATSEQVAELQKSLAEKQDSYILALMQTMKQRAEAVYALYKPLEEFGTAAGQAFATMTEDAEAGRDAFKAAIGDMINSMMKQTVQMTQEYIKRRLMQKVNDKLVSTQIKKSTKEQVDLEQGGADATSAITKAAGDAKVLLTEKVGQQVVNAVTTQTQTTTATAQSAAATDVSTQAAKTEANVGLGIAEGSAKTIGSLGWWGIPLIAVITAVLNGLLGFAMGKVSSLFGKGKDNNTNTKNTRVVSGMLTYDSGNVQDLRPFVGNNGSLYWATEDNKPYNGVSLLTRPTATTINGHPSLVAENGPELVIGRETTQAMMMNNPQLLKALVNYDRNYSGRRAYDTGNIAETSPTVVAGTSVSDEMVSYQASTNVALLQAVNTLLQRLEQPIEAKIDMYGRGKLYDSMTRANQFMKNK